MEVHLPSLESLINMEEWNLIIPGLTGSKTWRFVKMDKLKIIKEHEVFMQQAFDFIAYIAKHVRREAVPYHSRVVARIMCRRINEATRLVWGGN